MSVTSVNAVSGTSYSSAQSGNAPDLSAIVDDSTGKYTDDQRVQAYREREARDDAVMIPAFQKILASGDDATLWRSYIGLLNTLSPAEQNSPRYKGTRQEAMVGIAAGNGPNPLTSGPAGVETIVLDSEKPNTDSSSKVAAKAVNRWQDFLKGYNQSAGNSAPLLTNKVSTVSADLPSTNSVPTSSGPPANSTTVASTQPDETTNVPLGKAVDTKA